MFTILGWYLSDFLKIFQNILDHGELVSSSSAWLVVKPGIRALRSSLVMMLEPEVHLEALKLPPLYTQKGHPPKKNPLAIFDSLYIH